MPTAETTIDSRTFCAGPTSNPVNQPNAPTKATSQQSPQRPTARSMSTVATATVRRLCSRAMNTALTKSPPTDPGISVLPKYPTIPSLSAFVRVNGRFWARTRKYHRTNVIRTATVQQAALVA